MGHSQQPLENTDVAALSAGVVAVVISLFITPGVYDIINLVTSITLILVIISYAWNRYRGFVQSAAVAAVLGLCSIPGAGYLQEIYYSPKDERKIIILGANKYWDCKNEDWGTPNHPCRDKKPVSRVPNHWQAIWWSIILIVTLVGDRFLQRWHVAARERATSAIRLPQPSNQDTTLSQ
jgi:hypothetical protein